MKKNYTKPRVTIERFETSVMANGSACSSSIYLTDTPCGNIDSLPFDDEGPYMNVTDCYCLEAAQNEGYFFS